MALVNCSCKKPKYNYPEMVWCDKCGFEIKALTIEKINYGKERQKK